MADNQKTTDTSTEPDKDKADSKDQSADQTDSKNDTKKASTPAKKGPVSFDEGMSECSSLLSKIPDALDFSVKKNDAGRHYYSFDNPSEAAQTVRGKITVILKEIYDNGAYSYGQFARPLRVEGVSIQALLDEEFKEQNNL